ncbi:hypothetical protein OIU74_022342 [Salix koriyanagi]|uniref:Uncharacterized protein n=1 Tax=Salix koriyanagi TaxID=2511006 RepID=A0A9Q1AEX4_9ROSI|nr:hypothetical protein OIU74_022342 [Salix koriyanagi]
MNSIVKCLCLYDFPAKLLTQLLSPFDCQIGFIDDLQNSCVIIQMLK